MMIGRLEEEQMNTIPANLRPTGQARTLTRVSRQTQLYGVVAPYLSRLLHAHEIVVTEARAFARHATDAGDDGTNDLLVSGVIRTNEMQVWFLAEHLVEPSAPRAGSAIDGSRAFDTIA